MHIILHRWKQICWKMSSLMFSLWKWSFGEKYIAFNNVLWKLLGFKMNFVISQNERLFHPLQSTQLQELFNTCIEPLEPKPDSLCILAFLSMTVNKNFVLDLRNLPNKTVVKTNKEMDCQRDVNLYCLLHWLSYMGGFLSGCCSRCLS